MSLTRAILPVYDAAMRLALPVLSRNQRLKEGWDQRVFAFNLPTKADLWVQAASVGEAFLAWELVKGLNNPFAARPLRVLLTTNTKEGMSILSRVVEASAGRDDLELQTMYFPMDAPSIMRRALARIQPRTVVLLESEIWPGFLAACKEADVEVLLVNGRMSTKSLAGYLAWPRFFKDLGPDRILAMSERDGLRFSCIYGPSRVETMHNIKFDRLAPKDSPKETAKANPLVPLLGEKPSFVVFGSIRKEEEPQVLGMLEGFRAARPKTTVGLFPRHLQRVDNWQERLEASGIPYLLRSELDENDTIPAGSLVLWDTIGEMGAAFGLARGAFIGGSLAPVGGQNFLEPLAAGLVPVIGPHWTNFAWVGQEIIESGLVHQEKDAETCLNALLDISKRPSARKSVLKRFAAYVGERTGGAETACQRIAESVTRV